MATTKLTVRLPAKDLEFARQYARRHQLTVAELFDRYLKRLQDEVSEEIHPEVSKISGLIPPDVDAEAEYRDHLLAKHR